MLDLDKDREPVTPKDAATLLVLRDGAQGVEVFCVRRHAKSAFMGGVVVFPGGKLDAEDRAVGHTGGLHKRASNFAEDVDHGRALAVCACRESLEEAAILPATPAPDADACERLRKQLENGASFGPLLSGEGITLDTASLIPFARWVTPAAEARRYDARFFVTTLPEGQRGHHDARETTSSVWATPRKMLEAFMDGALFLAPPTVRALEILRDLSRIDDVAAICAEQSLQPICPELASTDPLTLVLPGDAEHSVAERRVSGPTRFVFRDGRLISENP